MPKHIHDKISLRTYHIFLITLTSLFIICSSVSCKQKDKGPDIDYYNKIVELNPNDAEAYTNRGIAKIKLKNFEGVIQDFNKAIELNPKNAEAYYYRGYAKTILKILLGSEDITHIQDFNKALELKPCYADAFVGRGSAKEIAGDYKGAIQDYNKAIELDPNNAEAYSSRGSAKIDQLQIHSGCLDWLKSYLIKSEQMPDEVKEFCKDYLLKPDYQ